MKKILRNKKSKKDHNKIQIENTDNEEAKSVS